MYEKDTLFAVGWHKGGLDFAVRASVQSLTYEEMRDLRQMIVVAIGVMERMWADAREKEHPTMEGEP